MPIYEYQCQACGERHEALQKFSDGALRKCPACGRLKLKRLVSAAAFHLKGTGWYVTDFRDKDKKKPGAESGSEAKTDESKTDESKSADAKDSKTDKEKTGDKKETKTPAKKEGKGKSGGSGAAASD